MSVKMMALVFERFEYGGNERLLALALADHAHDDGTNIYPGNARLAKKTLLSERTVIRLLQKLVKMGWLIKIGTGVGGRHLASEYEINPDWIKGDRLSPFNLPEERVTPEVVKGDKSNRKGDKLQVKKGDTVMSPQPSITKNNHQETSPRDAQLPKLTPEGELACWLINQKVQVSSMHPTLCAWVKDGFTKQHISECLALARQHKLLPELIPANYLDKIIRSKPKGQSNNWMMSDEATIAYGNKIGQPAKVGESMADYRQRLKYLKGNDDA